MKRLLLTVTLLTLLTASTAFATVPSDGAVYAGPYACDGADTTFTWTFGIDDDDDLEVVLITVATGAETTLTKTTHYTLTSATPNDPTSFLSGGTVTTVSTYTSAYQILLRRDTAKTQNYSGDEEMEEALDKLTRIVQDLAFQIALCLKIQPSEIGDTVLFDPDGTAGYAYRQADGDWVIAEGTGAGGEPTITADSVDETHIQLNNDAYLVADDAAGTGTVNLIKANSSDVPVLPDGAQLATSAAPDEDADIANKKYVDDAITAGAFTIANNTYLTATNAAGNGTVNLIKANAADVAVIPDGSELASTAAPAADADIANKKYVDDTVAAHDITASGATVFNTTMTSANTIQDLDLSATVGANTALVFLEVRASAKGQYAAIPKGYGGAFAVLINAADTENGGGCARATIEEASDYAYILTATNSSGVVSHGFSDNSSTITIKVICYFK